MRLLSVFVVAFLVTRTGGFSSAEASDPPWESIQSRGTAATMTGPNLMADSSFESLDPRVFAIDKPFRVGADPHAHSGKADAQLTLSCSGKTMYSPVGTGSKRITCRGVGSGEMAAAPSSSRPVTFRGGLPPPVSRQPLNGAKSVSPGIPVNKLVSLSGSRMMPVPRADYTSMTFTPASRTAAPSRLLLRPPTTPSPMPRQDSV